MAVTKSSTPSSDAQRVGSAAQSPLQQQKSRNTDRARALGIDPFSASSAEIEKLRPDITLSFHEKSETIRVTVRSMAPKRRNPIVKMIERFPGAEFLRSEKSYFFPTHLVVDLLRSAREREVSFAVECALGIALRESAPLRAELLQLGGRCGTCKELRDALLTPRIVSNGGGSFVALEGFCTPHLRFLFPDLATFTERRDRAGAISIGEIDSLIHRYLSIGLKLWIGAELQEEIVKVRERRAAVIAKDEGVFTEYDLEAIEPNAAWLVAESGRPGIAIREGATETERMLPAKLKKNRRADPKDTFAAYRFFPISRAKLTRIVGELDPLLETPAIKSVAFRRLFETLVAQDKIRERNLSYLTLKDVESGNFEFDNPEHAKRLFPHQRVAVKWLLETPRAFLGDDMGLGKTLTVLSAFELLLKSGECDFAFIVCPNSLTRNWAREVERWFPHRRFMVLPDQKKLRQATLRRIQWGALGIDGLIVNYESMRLEYVVPLLDEIISSRKTLLTVDESQRAKNPQSKTFQALAQLSAKCSRRVLLSGTPTPRDFSDIWAQILLLDDGDRFGRNYYDWLAEVADLGNRYSEYAVNSYRPDEVEAGIARVQEILLRRKKEDVVDLPEKMFVVRYVPLSGDQRDRYSELRKDLLLRVGAMSGEIFYKEISSILEEYLRAVQLASNPRLVDPLWKGEPAKFLELDEIVNEIVRERNEKIVIWTHFLGNLAELTKRYQHFGTASISGATVGAERQKVVEKFQSDDVTRVLIAIPAAGGVGLTLTRAQTAVYLEKTWNAEHWLQSIDRIHRIGQRGSVTILSLHSSRVDELIASNLKRKEEAQSRLLDGKQSLATGEGTNRTDSAHEMLPTREELLKALDEDER